MTRIDWRESDPTSAVFTGFGGLVSMLLTIRVARGGVSSWLTGGAPFLDFAEGPGLLGLLELALLTLVVDIVFVAFVLAVVAVVIIASASRRNLALTYSKVFVDTFSELQRKLFCCESIYAQVVLERCSLPYPAGSASDYGWRERRYRSPATPLRITGGEFYFLG